MKIVFLGDISGRSGRDAVHEHFKTIQTALKPDCVIINVDNAAHGFGVNPKICDDLFTLGAHVLTGGNHIWDQREIIPYIEKQHKLLRPQNYPEGTIGKGFTVYDALNGQKILVIHVLGRVFMDLMDDPFLCIDKILNQYKLGQNVQAIFVDIHAEATSEKMALAHYLDGRVTAVVGTHTHLPTADAQIFSKGTAFMGDAGMCGDYNSVIGVKAHVPVTKFTQKLCFEKMSPAEGEGTVCGVFIESDDKTGRAVRIEPIRIGARLSNVMPVL
jgi:metallophosphoesterase (TIGR00282 family)